MSRHSTHRDDTATDMKKKSRVLKYWRNYNRFPDFSQQKKPGKNTESWINPSPGTWKSQLD